MERSVLHLSYYFIIFVVNCDFSSSMQTEKECLIDLPMSQLLKIKRSMDELNCASDEPLHDGTEKSNEVNTVNKQGYYSSALPLIGEDYAPRSFHMSDPWNERPTKIQTVFQVSITALSFLAFGGYLLCMIVQAIKSKGTTYLHSGSNTNGNTVNTLKKIKIYRRDRRNAKVVNDTDSDRSDHGQAGPSPDELFKVLTLAAEGYVKILSV